MKKMIDLTKTWLTYNYESKNEECGGIDLELDGTEKTVADLYDWLLDAEADLVKKDWYEQGMTYTSHKDDTIYYKNKDEEEDWVTIKIYAKDEDEKDGWAYIPYSCDPITAVEV